MLTLFNPRSIILLICILQGLVFAALLVVRGVKKQSTADFWLAGLLVLLCLENVPHLIGFAGIYDAHPNLSYFPIENPFAVGAVIFLYVMTLTNSERKFTRKDSLLFIPALIYYCYRFIVFLQPINFKNWFDSAVQRPFVTPLLTDRKSVV